MKKEKISEILGNIDDKYVNEAAEHKAKGRSLTKTALRWGSVAAALCLVAVTVTFMPPKKEDPVNVGDGTQAGVTDEVVGDTEAVGDVVIPGPAGNDEIEVSVSFGELDRPYKEDNILGEEAAVVWPWEYLSTMEKFHDMELDGQEYWSRYRVIGEENLGDYLGSCTAVGHEYFFDRDGVTEHTENFEVYAIKDVPDRNLVAVKMDGEFVVYIKSYLREDYGYIKTLGELFDIFNLSETVTLSRFTVMDGYDAQGYYTVDGDSAIWDVLLGCTDAVTADGTISQYEKYISFTVTSEKLGIFKKAMYVSEDGYLWTNMNEWGYEYFIGVDAAAEIIASATENAVVAEYEPYQYYLSGTVTEVGDGYILVDDSVRCVDYSDGTTFRVITEDIRLSRCIDYLGIGVGDIVMVTFDGLVNVQDVFVINGATSIDPARIVDGDVLVEE